MCEKKDWGITVETLCRFLENGTNHFGLLIIACMVVLFFHAKQIEPRNLVQIDHVVILVYDDVGGDAFCSALVRSCEIWAL